MSRITWSRAASQDVDHLYAFLKQHDLKSARRAIERIEQSVQILREHPRIGRQAPGAADERREWPIRFGSGGYIVLYRITGDQITVLAVRHMREDGFGDA